MKIIIALVLFISQYSLLAQNLIQKGNTVPLVGYWKKGTTKNVLYTKSENKIKNGKKSSETTTVKALWQIKDSTEKYYEIHYTYKAFSFSNPNDSISKAYAEIFKGITVKYRTNELGVFDTIINLKEIMDISGKATNNIFKKLNWPDNEVTRSVIQKMKSLFNNENMLRASISEEMVLIHYFYGYEYKLNTPYTYDYYINNAIGSEPFPSKAVFKLTALNTTNDRAKIIAVITPIDKEYKRIIYQSMLNLSASLQLPKPQKSDFTTATTLHKCEAEVSITEGWPIKVTFTKSSSIKDTNTIEVITIILTD